VGGQGRGGDRQVSSDLIYFDARGFTIDEQHRRNFLAYYYNHAAARNQQVIMTYKDKDFAAGSGVVDLERGRMARGMAEPGKPTIRWIGIVVRHPGPQLQVGQPAHRRTGRHRQQERLPAVERAAEGQRRNSRTGEGAIARDGPLAAAQRRSHLWHAAVGRLWRGPRKSSGAFRRGEDQGFHRPRYPLHHQREHDLRHLSRLAGREAGDQIAGPTNLSRVGGPNWDTWLLGNQATIRLLGCPNKLRWSQAMNQGVTVYFPKEKPCQHAYVLKISCGRSMSGLRSALW